mmetsp:Transcript_43631/g.170731  ORF Transcript_43631/g.170731 Transcript_43631/m.170731 type:complete len:301 (-) Transcript_43631:1459-2361(-)|eukprot:CAMPEP_0113961692 /NCGR_PEP_ID=MMETSP0011_2-20120614/5467_1 /TAXON_ID=101924 /ORGANISM="Rhodosorus marinus" /LENGTH=300 /DNA_ID=CAMNT_0000973395 /DNA_START=217 /DNA_END=1116 /DNA_ORIENTATION=- /assembly_acc=CAM_ASM_000156
MPPRSRKPRSDPAITALERGVLEAVKDKKQGLTDAEILAALPQEADQNKRAIAYNSLLSKGKLQLLRRALDREPLYAPAKAEVAKLAGLRLNINETALYKLIEESNNKGIWSRDLRRCLNLPKVQLEKALKDLESRKLVKTVKSVSQANKKIYMLYNIQPAPELSGGPWFNENHDYDTECIRIIYQQVTALVKDRPNLSSKEICEKLNDSGLLNEKLTNDNVEQLLGTMVYDSMIAEQKKQLPDGTTKVTYYKSTPVPTYNALAETPCGLCPIISQCRPGGEVSPENCVYIDHWLQDIDW